MATEGRQWGAFAGGLLLGGAAAAGGAYLALRYAPSLRAPAAAAGGAADAEPARGGGAPPPRRRAHDARNGSPAPARRSFHGRRGPEGAANGGGANGHERPPHFPSLSGGGAAGLARTVTDAYYDPDAPPIASPPRLHGGGLAVYSPPGAAAAPSPADASDSGYGYADGARAHAAAPSGGFSEFEGATAAGARPAAVYAGPADRAHPGAAAAALRASAAAAALGVGAASPRGAAAARAAALAFGAAAAHGHTHAHAHALAPPHTPGSAATAPPPAGASPGSAAPAPPPPGLGLVTTADALAAEGRLVEDAALHEQYSRVVTPEGPPSEETEEVCSLLARALDLRAKWLFRPARSPAQAAAAEPEAARMADCLPPECGGDPFAYVPLPPARGLRAEMVDGVMAVFGVHEQSGQAERLFEPPGSATEFFTDMHWLLKV
jgi:hypothetical protein